MDVLYHALTGIAIAKSMDAPYIYTSAVAATLPDIVGIIPFYAIKFREAVDSPRGSFIKTYAHHLMSNKFAHNLDRATYRITHSFYGAAFFSLLSYIFFRDQWIVLSLSYLSHILIDIPTHEGDFATRILYPSSDTHFQGSNWSTHPKRFLLFWVILGIIIFLLWQR